MSGAPRPDKPPFSDVYVTRHAEFKWAQRANPGTIDMSWSDVWHDAVPVDYPPARGEKVGYYHEDADVVLIVGDAYAHPEKRAIISVIDLQDRPPGQQTYIREQAARAQ